MSAERGDWVSRFDTVALQISRVRWLAFATQHLCASQLDPDDEPTAENRECVYVLVSEINDGVLALQDAYDELQRNMIGRYSPFSSKG